MGHNFFTKIFENHQFTKTEALIDFHKKKGAINPFPPAYLSISWVGLGKVRLLILFVNDLMLKIMFDFFLVGRGRFTRWYVGISDELFFSSAKRDDYMGSKAYCPFPNS